MSFEKFRSTKTLSERMEQAKTTQTISEFECVHQYYGRRGKPNIEFMTNKGTPVILKWEKNEYRAYSSDNRYLGYGATIPKGLIEYLKEKI